MDSDDAAPALLQRREVSGGLRLDQAGEAEVLAGDRQLLARVVHDLDEQALVRAALVELACGVEVARAEPVRDDAAGLAARALDQRLELALARGVDERLDADVVALARLGEELVQRSLRARVRLRARGEHLVRLVLGGLHVRLVEWVDAEDGAGDGSGELPAEELLPELVWPGDADLVR